MEYISQVYFILCFDVNLLLRFFPLLNHTDLVGALKNFFFFFSLVCVRFSYIEKVQSRVHCSTYRVSEYQRCCCCCSYTILLHENLLSNPSGNELRFLWTKWMSLTSTICRHAAHNTQTNTFTSSKHTTHWYTCLNIRKSNFTTQQMPSEKEKKISVNCWLQWFFDFHRVHVFLFHNKYFKDFTFCCWCLPVKFNRCST